MATEATPQNPSAFPQHPSQMVAGERTWGAPGMDLRDYFAAQALTGIITAALGKADPFEETVAYGAYRIADAMLLTREVQS